MNTAEQRDMFESVEFLPEERMVFEMKEDLKTSEWAEKYRTVTMGGHVGPWRNEISPHTPFIMDTWNLPYVREVVVCKSPQTSGTEIMYNCEGSSLESDPSTAMFVMPSQDMARKVAEDRIIPMIEQSEGLRDLISDNPDDTAKQRIKFRNGGIIYMAWANSSSALATFPIKRLYLDEVDKYPVRVGKETDSITLGEKRQRTFPHTFKRFKVSTPTIEDGPIWKALHRCDVIYHYHASCPSCAHSQVFKLENLKYPEDMTAEEIERGKHATYECDECHEPWNDRKRNMAVRNGEWKAIKGKGIRRPRRVGFHLPSWISSDVSLSEIAGAYIISKHDKIKLIDFYNDYKAEPFIETEEGESVHEEVLYERRRDYGSAKKEWQVPMDACLLTAFFDVQKNRLEGEVVAWGPGMESWGIHPVIIPGDPSLLRGTEGSPWDILDEYVQRRQWIHESGAKLRLSITGVDSGYLAPKVYSFVRPLQARRVYACKGSSTRGRPLVTIASKKPKGKKRVLDKYRVILVTIGTEAAKDQLLANMEIEAPGPGYMHYHTGYSLNYFRQLTAEQAVTEYDKNNRPYRVWKEKHRDAPNEAIDIRVGNYAMLELLNPNLERLSEALKGGTVAVPPKNKRKVRSRGVKN